MKKLILLFILIFIRTILHAQQFSFPVYFTDALGNRDTIVLGYDTTATDSIDAAFGEINIISIPLNAGLDVRITDEYTYRNWPGTPGTFHTKKQIVNTHCSYSDLSTIDIFTSHWPVTAAWDSTIFNDSCRFGSLFTSIHPGGWWDTGSPSNLERAVFFSMDSVTFTSNASGLPIYGYLNNNGDTISVFWQIFGDNGLLSTSINENNISEKKMSIYPNPSHDKISLKLPSGFGNVLKMEVYSATGKLLKSLNGFENLPVLDYQEGIYFIVATNEKGLKLSGSFLKL